MAKKTTTKPTKEAMSDYKIEKRSTYFAQAAGSAARALKLDIEPTPRQKEMLEKEKAKIKKQK